MTHRAGEKPIASRLGSLMLIRMLVNTVHRMVYPLLPIFSAGLGVSLPIFSTILALRSGLGGLSPLLASISDRHGRRFGILLGLTILLSGLALVIIVPSPTSFFICIILAGLGKYLIDPSVHAYLGDQIPFEGRGRAIAMVEYGWSLSYLIGVPLMAYVISLGGWVAPFPLLLLFTFISLWLIYRVLPRSETRPNPDSQQPRFRDRVMDVLRSPVTRSGLLLGFCISAANEMVSLVFGIWLEDSFNLSVTALGAATIVIGAAELFGEGAVSRWTDRLGKKTAVRAGILLNSGVALLFAWQGNSVPAALAILFLFYLSFEFSIVSSISLISELSPGARATLLGFYVTAISLGRAGADLIAPYALTEGLYLVIAITLGFNLLGIASLRGLPGFQPPVLEKNELAG